MCTPPAGISPEGTCGRFFLSCHGSSLWRCFHLLHNHHFSAGKPRSDPAEPSLLQAEQTQPSVLLPVASSPHCTISVALHRTLSNFSVPLLNWGRLQLGSVLQVSNNKCQAEWNNGIPRPVGYALADTSWDTVCLHGCKGRCCPAAQLAGHQASQTCFSSAYTPASQSPA